MTNGNPELNDAAWQEADAGWDDESVWSDLPVIDIPYMIRQLKLADAYLAETGDINTARYIFFDRVLGGYYDPMTSGMNRIVGHIAYRLSDLVDERERARMMIYPSPSGSIIDVDLDDTASDLIEPHNMWDSLEDWRQSWSNRHPVIPEFEFWKQLPKPALLELAESTEY